MFNPELIKTRLTQPPLTKRDTQQPLFHHQQMHSTHSQWLTCFYVYNAHLSFVCFLFVHLCMVYRLINAKIRRRDHSPGTV